MLMSSIDREVIFGSGHNAMYGVLMYHTYPEAAAKVAEWEKAKEKPQKTIMQDFFEKYPNANKYGDGTPTMRPCTLGYPIEGCAEHSCRECWSRPLEQIGGEEG